MFTDPIPRECPFRPARPKIGGSPPADSFPENVKGQAAQVVAEGRMESANLVCPDIAGRLFPARCRVRRTVFPFALPRAMRPKHAGSDAPERPFLLDS
ncbi:MAG: hypothetical protein KGJ60_12930 [Verrucomicrobiota bacterium]|nr:hypothetical protein [Verrucomicrobiota bacterium]